MAVVELPIADAMRGLTLDVVMTGQRRAAARVWAGAQLIRLGAWVIGCDIEVGMEPTDTDVIRYQPVGGGPERMVLGRRIRS